MILALYLLLLAGFFLFMNLRTYRQPAKTLTYFGIWAALAGSATAALLEFT